jgi:hypothetical protein
MASTETSLLPIEDYEAIEAAVKETSRGRWFLEEYARRNRQADTLAIVATLERLEKTIKVDRAAPDIDRIRLDLADMAEAIVRTKHEIAQIQHEGEHGNRFQQASNELDAIVVQTEGATNAILLNAERIQELAWTLREQGVDDAIADGLDAAATDIYTSCSFQDLTGQRTRKVVTVLRYLESRINAMMSIWGLESLVDTGLPIDVPPPVDPTDGRPDAHLLNGPALIGHGNDQDSIDDIMIDDSALAAIAAEEVEALLQPQDDVGLFAAAEAASAQALAQAAAEPPAVAEQVLADDLDLVAAPAEEEAPGHEPALFAPPAEAVEPAALPVEIDPADYREADVFAPAPAVTAPASQPTIVRQRVGNTVQEVAVVAAAEIAPALAVVESLDPIVVMSAERRLLTFG